MERAHPPAQHSLRSASRTDPEPSPAAQRPRLAMVTQKPRLGGRQRTGTCVTNEPPSELRVGSASSSNGASTPRRARARASSSTNRPRPGRRAGWTTAVFIQVAVAGSRRRQATAPRGAWQVQGCVYAAARRPGNADEAAHREPAGVVVLDVPDDRASVACVPPADVRQHNRPQHRRRPRDPRVLDDPQHPGLEYPAPDPLLGAWHLDDARPVLHVGRDGRGDHARADRAAEVAGVLVQKAVRDEHDLAAACVDDRPLKCASTPVAAVPLDLVHGSSSVRARRGRLPATVARRRRLAQCRWAPSRRSWSPWDQLPVGRRAACLA